MSGFRGVLTSARPQQWVKNLFVLAPLLFGGRLDSPPAMRRALLAFVCFSLASGGVYILNDLADREADLAHPEKRRRPIASSQLGPGTALSGALALLAVAAAAALRLGPRFEGLLLAYLVLSVAYSLALKRAAIVDAMAIATGFVLRVVGGAAAVDVEPSHWLIVCAFLLALYLALAKRRQELLLLSAEARDHRRSLSGYSVEYLDQVSGVLLGATLVCYALYTVAPETVARFHTDALVYGTIFVLYGLLRYMSLLQDPAHGGNPTRLLLTDKPLLASVAGWALYNAAVVYRGTLVHW
ncbi:MAG: decaprenyl-phosphate phosphoribosyltransferase [Acidobacteria bacterium]|nr:decaprenyl-phosphate phosphoribosyltransferase [Acidobacteriota bacterium]